MTKAELVEIAQQSFYVNKDAYRELEAYLDQLTKHFKSADIMQDIESSIADKLRARAVAGHEVVSQEDVRSVIAEMGSIAALTGDEPESSDSKTTETSSPLAVTRPKRLLRSRDDVYISGLASGIAAYFGTSPLAIRLIFLISFFVTSGFPAVIYVAMWILVPQSKSIEDDMIMQGKEGTLKDIESAVIKRTQELRQEHGNDVDRYARSFANTLTKLTLILVRSVGLAIILAAGFAGAVWTAVGVSLLPGQDRHAATDILGSGLLPVETYDYLALGSGWLASLALAAIAIILGISMVRLKASINKPALFISTMVLIVSAAVALVFAVLSDLTLSA